MRAAELDLIFVPESGSLSPEHWQARWRAKLSSARLIETGEGVVNASAVVEAASRARLPIFFIAHSTGAIAVAQAAAQLSAFDVRGAFLVAPPSQAALATLDGGRWGDIPRSPLPWPSLLVASGADPWATPDQSRALAADWGAQFVDAGEAGRLDEASGHGPWPDGLLRLAGLFKRL